MSDTDGLAAETRRLLDAATELTAEWYIERTYNKRVPDHWSVDVLSDDDHVCSVRGGDEGAHALAALIAAAPRLLANWLAREDTDVLSVYPDLVLQLRSLSDRSCNAAADIIEQLAAERDEAERRERTAINIAKQAEAEARQLREAIREHKDRHNSWRQQTQRPSDIALWAALNAAAVAEGAEDR